MGENADLTRFVALNLGRPRGSSTPPTTACCRPKSSRSSWPEMERLDPSCALAVLTPLSIQDPSPITCLTARLHQGRSTIGTLPYVNILIKGQDLTLTLCLIPE